MSFRKLPGFLVHDKSGHRPPEVMGLRRQEKLLGISPCALRRGAIGQD